MTETQPAAQYRLLPGRSRKGFGLFAFSSQRLWMGNDHLLLCIRSIYSESSKRFYFNDIQAIEVFRTRTGNGLSIILGLLLAVMLGLAVLSFVNGAEGFGVFLSILACFNLFCLVFHLAAGPTCLCRIRTAVQVVDIECLRRLRTAHKVIEMIRPMIEGVQGPVTESMLAAALPETPYVAPEGGANVVHPSPPLNDYDGRMHLYGFLFFLAMAATILIDLVFRHQIKDLFDMLLLVGLIITVVLSLQRHRHRQSAHFLKRPLLFGIVTSVLFFAASMIYATVIATGVALEHQGSQVDIMQALYAPGVMADPVFRSIHGIGGLLMLLTALWGLLAYQRWQTKRVSGVNTGASAAPESPSSQD